MLERLTTLSYRSGNLGAYLTELVLSVSQLIQSDWTIITVYEGETGQVIASSVEIDWDNAEFSLHGTLVNEVVQSGRSLIIEDSHQDVRRNQLSQEYRGYLGIPLRTTDRTVIGTICSFLRTPRAIAESEIKMVESFAERAAITIENYQLYQEQLQFNERLSQAVAACSIDLKQSQEKLIERERLAAIGEFTTMIVHEVRNPLTTIELGLRYAQKVLPSDADKQRLTLALSESHRLNRLLQEILCYAKPQVLKLSTLNIKAFLDDVLMQIQDLPEAVKYPIDDVKECPDIEVMADGDKLKQVLFNLFRNAFEAMQDSHSSKKTAPLEKIKCSIKHGVRANWICISIHNGGTPIPPELLPQLTKPFCSTKPSGTGLGLAISKRIIVAHGGELEITSSDSGTTVNVHLPISC
ncbi:MAG: ATP-binding protein [Oculatellaceae cyanobacterium bins.114]|nr:ATP-binding protein [Oculatellaceae cyanobacterium bins.114]